MVWATLLPGENPSLEHRRARHSRALLKLCPSSSAQVCTCFARPCASVAAECVLAVNYVACFLSLSSVWTASLSCWAIATGVLCVSVSRSSGHVLHMLSAKADGALFILFAAGLCTDALALADI